MAKQSHRGGLRLWSERVAGVVLFFNRLFPLIVPSAAHRAPALVTPWVFAMLRPHEPGPVRQTSQTIYVLLALRGRLLLIPSVILDLKAKKVDLNLNQPLR